MRKLEPTSLARATGYNRDNIDRFFDNLVELYTKYKYKAHQVYNANETGVKTVQDSQTVTARKGTRQVGQKLLQKRVSWSRSSAQQMQREIAYHQ